MLKFFRRVRQKFLAENKVTRYLLYAFGEILLVVIGIMLALQVNNWNTERVKLIEEKNTYIKVIKDLESDSTRIAYAIRNFKIHQDIHFQVYDETQLLAGFDSTLNYGRLYWKSTFIPRMGNNYGEIIPEFSNEEIRELLNNYILFEKRVLDAFKDWDDMKVNTLIPYFANHGILNTKLTFQDAPRYEMYTAGRSEKILIQYDKLKERYGSVELDQNLFDLRWKTSWIIVNLERLGQRNERLKKVLNNELNR